MEQLQTSEDVEGSIAAIIRLRREASQTDVDRRVALTAIRAAEEVIKKVALTRSPRIYCATIIQELQHLMDGYYDPDGEYSAGIGDIGSVVARIKLLLLRIAD